MIFETDCEQITQCPCHRDEMWEHEDARTIGRSFGIFNFASAIHIYNEES